MLAAAENAVVAALTRYHASHPLEDGMPREEVRERVFANASPQVFDHVLQALERQEAASSRATVWRWPGTVSR